jgi:hypothetical protein
MISIYCGSLVGISGGQDAQNESQNSISIRSDKYSRQPQDMRVGRPIRQNYDH